MFNVLEIVGISKDGYSEAISQGINALKTQGKKPSYFEVISLRGAVHDAVIEYQATLKVGMKE